MNHLGIELSNLSAEKEHDAETRSNEGHAEQVLMEGKSHKRSLLDGDLFIN